MWRAGTNGYAEAAGSKVGSSVLSCGGRSWHLTSTEVAIGATGAYVEV